MEMKIRAALPEDAEELLEIYRPYVENTAITFEYEVPTVEEFRGRIENTLRKYPYLVAQEHGVILGYAYASPFKERAAYDWSVEISIYVQQDARRKGIGKKLYLALENCLKEQHILNANACIAYLEQGDAYLTTDSVRFHTSMGFQLVGEFHQCGYKFHRWYNMVWMEKMIGKHTTFPEDVKRFQE